MDSLWNISSIFKRRPTVQIRQHSVLVFLPALSSWAALETCHKAQTNSSKKKTDHCDLKGSIRLDCSQPSPQEWSLTKYRGQLFKNPLQWCAVHAVYSSLPTLQRFVQSGSEWFNRYFDGAPSLACPLRCPDHSVCVTWPGARSCWSFQH